MREIRLNNLIIGIDPGLKGAVAVIDFDGNLVSLFDLPTKKQTLKNGKKKTLICAQTLHQTLSSFSCQKDNWHVYVEQVSSRTGEGVVGAFSFGQGFGTLLGVIGSFGIEPATVPPVTWKTSLGLKGMDKEETTAHAQEIYPSGDLYSKRKNKKGGFNALDGRGDALLLCTYALKQLKNL